MLSFFVKGLRTIFILIIILALINQHSENKRFKIYINELYFNTLNELYNEADSVEEYISRKDADDIDYLHVTIGRLQKIEVELYNIQQQIPKSGKYYSAMFQALYGKLGVLIQSKTEDTFIDSEFIKDK